MSFRKRSEVIGRPLPNRIPPGIPGRVPLPNKGGPNLNSGPITREIPNVNPHKDEEPDVQFNPGIRSSLITSQPTISTGTSDLDKILGHQGLPLGNSLLLEESGTTDFASVLLRVFASQGIMQNRLESKTLNCHVIVVGFNAEWSKELPGLYKGSSKDKKKAVIREKESAISVSNLSNKASLRDNDLKIAWRYGLNKKNAESDAKQSDIDEVNENYNHQFDITERMKPIPDNSEISYIPITDYKKMLSNIQDIIKFQTSKNNSKIIRLIIPNLLIPSLYPPNFSKSSVIIPFIHGLRSILKTYQNNVSLMYSLPIDLYPRSSNVVSIIEQLSDAVINLEPFHQTLSTLIEKAYKNEPSKVQHGFVNILKLPILSERGLMTIHKNEFAFKNGRKKFEIEPWGIPVEIDEETPNKNPAVEETHQHQHQSSKNIEF